jgi:arsenate reductase
MEIYYNPRCSKCREAFNLIESKGKKVKIVDYLNNPPSAETLKSIVGLLGITPLELFRKKEPLFIEKFAHETHSDDEWLQILSENPILIERPIVIKGKKAVIGRPTERILEII